MSDLTRAEIEEFWETWLQVNRDAEKSGDWRVMAEWYAEDATYGWMYGPDEHFMAVGRDQIRDWAIGIEMDGSGRLALRLPVPPMIDEQEGMVVGFWKQRSGIIDDATGKEYEVLGLGGSWFGVERQAGRRSSSSRGSATGSTSASIAHTMGQIVKSGKAPDTLLKRIEVFGHERARPLPPQGHPLERLAAAGRAGDYVTQDPDD